MAKSETTRGGAARKGASGGAGAKGGAGARGGARARGAAEGRDLRAELRDFASARPEGWSHQDWLTFLDHLREKGHDTSNPDQIGLMLERERLAAALAQVEGMGPKRVDALVSRFDTLWSFRQASVEEVASVPGMNRALAERVKEAVR